jgi:hypothetical protein
MRRKLRLLHGAVVLLGGACLRHDDYHELDDTPEKLNYDPMADVVWGLKHVVEAVANPMRRRAPP